MKKLLFILLALAFSPRLFAQQFMQYNTGTLYESFENPSQKAFIVDSSRRVAFNFFIPNFNTNAFLAGNVQASLKNRAFSGQADQGLLVLNQGQLNRANANFNSYWLMFRFYQNLENNSELGFFAQTKGEGRGIFSDDIIQIMDNYTKFPGTEYANIANSSFAYQAYHQIGVAYRQDLDDQISFGAKVSFLMGIINNKVNINQSNVRFDKPNDRAFVSLTGQYFSSFEPGEFNERDFLPSFKHPGAGISFGMDYKTSNGYKWQFNVKDLGFIHWNKRSTVGNFSSTGIIGGLSDAGREDSILNTASALVQTGGIQRSFTTPTNARFEVSTSRSYWPLYNKDFKLTPTVILSKELFYTGFTGALVNHFQYKSFVGTLSASYNDLKQYNIGAQLMIKSPNAEFFIGTERLHQTTDLVRGALDKDSPYNSTNGRYSGADFFLGFSIKLARVVESRENASFIPMGPRKSIFKRVWSRFFGDY